MLREQRPTSGSASSTTSRSRRSSCSAGCRGGAEIVEGSARRRRARVPACERCDELRRVPPTSTTSTATGDDRPRSSSVGYAGARSSSARSRSRSTWPRSRSRRRARGTPAGDRHPPASRLARGDPARRRPARLHEGHRQPPAGVREAARRRPPRPRAARAGAGRHAHPRGCRDYQDERREIEQIVGEINGRHARLGFPVIHYLYRTLPLEELIPLYRAGDVMLVTPFRDGMNLVAKEYVAARRRRRRARALASSRVPPTSSARRCSSTRTTSGRAAGRDRDGRRDAPSGARRADAGDAQDDRRFDRRPIGPVPRRSSSTLTDP
jgi:hypothetical protein